LQEHLQQQQHGAQSEHHDFGRQWLRHFPSPLATTRLPLAKITTLSVTD
jgi:hypothetical protein